MKIDGGCHCGSITYEAEVDPETVVICHCTDCQSLSGSAFRTVVPTAEADFELLSGAPKIYVKTAASGRSREQAFCPDCGSHLYATSVGGAPRLFGLRVGTIRQRGELAPKKQLWRQHALGWLDTMAKLPTNDAQ
ncbi:MAG: GFA family protein [Rhodospirillales bacterium]